MDSCVRIDTLSKYPANEPKRPILSMFITLQAHHYTKGVTHGDIMFRVGSHHKLHLFANPKEGDGEAMMITNEEQLFHGKCFPRLMPKNWSPPTHLETIRDPLVFLQKLSEDHDRFQSGETCCPNGTLILADARVIYGFAENMTSTMYMIHQDSIMRVEKGKTPPSLSHTKDLFQEMNLSEQRRKTLLIDPEDIAHHYGKDNNNNSSSSSRSSIDLLNGVREYQSGERYELSTNVEQIDKILTPMHIEHFKWYGYVAIETPIYLLCNPTISAFPAIYYEQVNTTMEHLGFICKRPLPPDLARVIVPGDSYRFSYNNFPMSKILRNKALYCDIAVEFTRRVWCPGENQSEQNTLFKHTYPPVSKDSLDQVWLVPRGISFVIQKKAKAIYNNSMYRFLGDKLRKPTEDIYATRKKREASSTSVSKPPSNTKKQKHSST
jgi:hypothetical protein